MNTKKTYLTALVLGLLSFTLHKAVFALAGMFAPSFQVQAFDISGLSLVPVPSGLDALKGRPLRSLNLIEIKKGLVQHPLIADAALYKEYPSTLKIVFKERTPIAELHSGGQVYVVDASARSLPLKPQGNVPQIYADFGIALDGVQIIDENISTSLKAVSLPAAANVASLSISRDKGSAFALKKLSTSFYTGSQPFSESLFKKAQSIAEDIKIKGSRTPKMIDLSSGGDSAVGYF